MRRADLAWGKSGIENLLKENELYTEIERMKGLDKKLGRCGQYLKKT